MQTTKFSINSVEHILEQGSAQYNEDCLVIEKNLFGVFDGASSLDNALFDNGRTGGMIAAGTARDEFSKNHFPLEKLGVKANQAILSKMLAHKLDISCRHRLWSTSAAVVRVKNKTLEWLQTGDAQIILVYRDTTFKVLADRKDHDYATLTQLKQDNFCRLSPSFKNQLKRVRAGMNKHYGVFNGDDNAMEFTLGGFEDLSSVATILLFTDGLCLPQADPAPQKTYKELVRIFLEKGLEGLKDHVRQIESQDPDIRVFPRFKRHDDIAAIALHM